MENTHTYNYNFVSLTNLNEKKRLILKTFIESKDTKRVSKSLLTSGELNENLKFQNIENAFNRHLWNAFVCSLQNCAGKPFHFITFVLTIIAIFYGSFFYVYPLLIPAVESHSILNSLLLINK